MAKEKVNNMLFPPDGGEWLFQMKDGKTHKGILHERYDDFVIIVVESKYACALRISEITEVWQEIELGENKTKSEA